MELRDWICSVNGERIHLKGANLGPTRQALADATSAELAADVALAKQAGLDFLRVLLGSDPSEVMAMFDQAPGSGQVEMLARRAQAVLEGLAP